MIRNNDFLLASSNLIYKKIIVAFYNTFFNLFIHTDLAHIFRSLWKKTNYAHYQKLFQFIGHFEFALRLDETFASIANHLLFPTVSFS